MSESDGKITWFEIAGADGAHARGFYGSLFGWQFQPFEEGGDYQMTYEAGGAVYSAPDKGILVYFGTSDIDASVARVRELGGEAGVPQEIANVGRYATCSDTEGNTFGLYQRGLRPAGDPAGGRRGAGRRPPVRRLIMV
ncbi:MAG TPA: VOC family protein [Gaiellaceae bacterium]|nr:VOC family protein [Gaiellaceae bacterium]